MARVDVERVSKSFGATQVLKEVSLSVAEGEFLVLVGPSGCGKSTLLRMVAGLEEPSSGNILIDSQVVNRVPPKARGVAMVFQNYALYPHMTVRENLSFALSIARLEKKEIAKRVSEVAEVLGLSEQLEKKPGQLSGGQKQRVAMGRAMVRQPKVFLFDEPLSNLDAQLRVKMRAEIGHLHRKLKATTIYVTHDQVEAMTLADRIAVMHRGHLEQVGSPLEVYRYPKTRFVAGFMGTPSINWIESTLAQRCVDKLQLGSQVKTVGVRPENLYLKKLGETGPGVDLGKGKVTLVEPLGALAYIHLVVEGCALICETRSPELPRIDEEIGVGMLEEGVLCFDTSGNRL